MIFAAECVDRAFARIAPNIEARGAAHARWAVQMALPQPRPYHNAAHINAVLDRIWAWSASRSSGEPSTALLAAALYHDVIYEATRKDNEAESARFCQRELEAIGGLSEVEINEAARLIELTAGHVADANDMDGILLLDADLYILGDTPENYDAYVSAVRTEYAHVSGDAWRKGRPAVMRTFLERPRIYHGNWAGRDEREKQARANIAREIADLESGA